MPPHTHLYKIQENLLKLSPYGEANWRWHIMSQFKRGWIFQQVTILRKKKIANWVSRCSFNLNTKYRSKQLSTKVVQQNFHVFHTNTEKAKELFPVLSRNHYFHCIWSKKLFPCAACLLLNNDDVFEHIRCLDRGEHWQGVKCFLEGISDTSPTSLTHSHTQQPSQLKPTWFLLFP